MSLEQQVLGKVLRSEVERRVDAELYWKRDQLV